MRIWSIFAVAFLTGCLFSTTSHAQWMEGFGLPGVFDASKVAVAGDKIFVSGSQIAGSEMVQDGMAAYSIADGVWSSLEGWPSSFDIRHLTSDENGGLYVSGNFTELGGIEVNRIAHYDVASGQWSALGAGLGSAPSAITVHENTLYLAHKVGTLTRVVTWANNEWSLLGEIQGSVYDLIVGDEHLYVAGEFSGIDDIESYAIIAYDLIEELWQPVGKGVVYEHNPSFTRVYHLGWYDGVLYLTGSFTHGVLEDGQTIPAQWVASWNVAQQMWHYEEAINGISIFGNDAAGNLYAGGIYMLQGNEWVDISGTRIPENHGLMELHTILPYGEGLLLGHSALYLDTEGEEHTRQVLYTLDPATETWGVIANQASNGVDKMVYALASDDAHGVYVGGNFQFAGSLYARSVAYLHDSIWTPLGGGTNRDVHSLHIAESGMVYAGGNFSAVYQESEEIPAKAIAVWDPANAQWEALGGGIAYSNENAGWVHEIAETPDGKIVVAGSFQQVLQTDGQMHAVNQIAQWNPTEGLWEVLPQDHGIPVIYALAVDDGGNIYAGGDNRMSTGISRVARLSSGASEWEILKDWPESFMIMDFALWGNPTGSNGELYVATFGQGVWRWSNSQWQMIGGAQYATAVEMNGIPGQGGELYVGDFTLRNLCLWRGGEWGSVPGSTFWGESLYYHGGPTIALEVMPTSANEAMLWVGGSVLAVNGHVSSGIAAYETVNYVFNEDTPDSADDQLSLSAYPNPAMSQATVSFSVPHSGDVAIHVYDMLGRRVMTLVDDFRAAGSYDLELDTRSLAGGTYILQLISGDQRETVRFTSVR